MINVIQKHEKDYRRLKEDPSQFFSLTQADDLDLDQEDSMLAETLNKNADVKQTFESKQRLLAKNGNKSKEESSFFITNKGDEQDY